jgi:hypothetical protein
LTATIIPFESRKHWEEAETCIRRVALVALIAAPSEKAALALFAIGDGQIIASRIDERDHDTDEAETTAKPSSPGQWEIHHSSLRYVTYTRKVIAASREEAQAKFQAGRGKPAGGQIGDEIAANEFGLSRATVVESFGGPI